MINEFFIENITNMDEVKLLENFIDLLANLGAITDNTWENTWDHKEDELTSCYDCEEMKYNCTCEPEYHQEYDDEASF